MQNLTVFENPAFGTVRTVEVEGEPWLVGKDVAEALGYSNTRGWWARMWPKPSGTATPATHSTDTLTRKIRIPS